MSKVELIIAPHHRFSELSVHMADGSKVWINKWAVTTIDRADLADGEEFALRRYVEEGRITAVELADPPPARRARKPRKDEDDDDPEEE